MGYRALRQKREAKAKLLKRVMLCIFAVLAAIGLAIACIIPPESWKYHFSKPEIDKRRAGEMRVHFLDVGQGDSTLIELPDGKVMLVDGGDDSSQTKKRVLRYLNALDIDKIDYLVVTHADSDHCGSLEEIFRYKKVLNAYLSPSFDLKDVEYAEVYEGAVKENCNLVTPSRRVRLDGKGETPYTLCFLYPYAPELVGEMDAGENESSVVVWLEYMGTSVLLCGDAPESVEEKLMRDDRLELLTEYNVDLTDTDILKVGHHGSDSSSTEVFLNYLGVETAVISCGKDNTYGHPTKLVLNRLLAVGAAIYRTDMQGHIVATVNATGEYTMKSVRP